ncbi:MAG TPA: 3-oxoacid CoA-transferase, partial [Cupriavidus sp.]|nr:3-oxoacid CoA-transferase [Cupriavidus sp.]
MQSKLIDAAETAVADIESGASIFVGGFGGAGIPRQLLAALLNSTDVGDLTLINNNAGSGDPSFLELVRVGRVRRIVCSYPRMPGSEFLRDRVIAGSLVVEVMPQGTLVERIRAAGAGLGAFFTPTGYGTPFAEGKETRV